MNSPNIKLVLADNADSEYAAFLSTLCSFEIESAKNRPSDLIYLELNENGLKLTDGNLEIMADLSAMLSRLKPSNLSGELLVRIAKVRESYSDRTRIVDATAGFGEDSLLLAASGMNVDLYEYNPVIYALLYDSLTRAKHNPLLTSAVNNMTLHFEDSTRTLNNLDFRPDVVLLDPMFPERSKSGLIKKKFQLLQKLERPCSTEEELLKAAFAAKPQKIIIKRPAKGPCLCGIKPNHSLVGKAIRYDCLVGNNFG